MAQPSYFRSLVRQVTQGRSTRSTAASWKHAVEWLEERQLLDSSPSALAKMAGADPAHFVTELYKDLLERRPQAAEVLHWVNTLAAGASRDQVAREFISSPEYRTNWIRADYANLLKRQARPDEVAKWSQDLQPGDDETQARAKFLASEVYSRNQMRDSLTWLANVYEDILGRPPDSSGSNSWTNALNQEASREQVALGIINSVEANTRVVVSAYHKLLGRRPDASGLNSFVSAMGQGLSPKALNLILVSSSEYLNKHASLGQAVQADFGSRGDPLGNVESGYNGIPDFGSAPTTVSLRSGAWSDPSIWSAGRLPTTDDVVAISGGTTVTYDVVSNTHLHALAVQEGGALHFRTDLNTQVIVGNFLVAPEGELEVGTESNPVADDVMAKIIIADQPIDPKTDPEQYGTGLIGLGKVTMHGAAKTSFARLAVEPLKGDTTLLFAEPVAGWRRGDELLVPDTRFLNYRERYDSFEPQWEEVNIQSVSSDGRVVTLSAPLQFDHLGSRDHRTGELDFLPHVMNRTRNVMIASEKPNDEDAVRGHTLFTGRADVDIRFTGFCGLGRTTTDPIDNTTFDANSEVNTIGTNQSGRYPMYIDQLMGPVETPKNGHQFTLVGNAIDGDPDEIDESYNWKWGLAIKDSHYGLIKDNVVYAVSGAGIVAEDGSESFNVIDHNMVARVDGNGRDEDLDGTAGTAFWLRGPNNYVRNNVAVDLVGGLGSYGFNLIAEHLGEVVIPAYPGADKWSDGLTVNMNQIPILEFSNNEVYGATARGLAFWWIGTRDGNPYDGAGESVIKDFRAWNTWSYAVFQYPSYHVTIDGLVLRNDGYDEGTFGFNFGDYSAFEDVIINADIQGFWIGISMPSFADTTTIENSFLENHIDILVNTPFSTNGNQWLPAKRAIINNVVFAAPEDGSFASIVMNFRDRDSNAVLLDQVFVYNYDGNQGDNFQVYYLEQAPDYVVPQTDFDHPHGGIGSPEAGLTNQQNWLRYGIAVAGAITPTEDMRPDVAGFVRAI